MNELFEVVYQSLGIYPSSVLKNGVETKRTEYEEGWNAALFEISKRHLCLIRWRNKLEKKDREAFDYLLSHTSRLSIDFDENNQILLFMTVNDVFVPAAVLENITIKDLVALAEIHVLYGEEGIFAFFKDRYKHDRTKRRIDEIQYKEAIKTIESKFE